MAVINGSIQDANKQLGGNPTLKAQKQSMDSGDYLRAMLQVLNGPGAS